MNKASSQYLNNGLEFQIHLDQDLEEAVPFIDDQFPISVITQSFSLERKDYIPLHWHNYWQLYWVKKGSLDFQVNSHRFELNSRNLLVMNSRQFHQSKVALQDTQAICIIFDINFINSYLLEQIVKPFLNKEPFTFKLLPVNNEIERLLSSLFDGENATIPYLSIASLITRSLDQVINYFEGDHDFNSQDQVLFNEILSYIQNNYDKQIRVSDLLKHVGINKNYLNQLFHTYTGQPPIKYINQFRLQKAQQLVIYTDQPISDIAYNLGFSHISYFIEQFRKEYGLSPLQYRKQFS
ncbi:helix-turn-helix transcriptional regulator [Hutsoniella sourekii]|uniref:helix-turn-helix transcriptional regulator n=1 Tax=Hutsoniella sourekii TaxID=87650 RepID=UPI000481F09C|nr:AraC family transcriptional regulator [Hutsoniella sourekii]